MKRIKQGAKWAVVASALFSCALVLGGFVPQQVAAATPTSQQTTPTIKTADQYITITHQYTVWQSTNFTTHLAVSATYLQTYHATGVYETNGNKYWQLSDDQGKVIGYVNQAGCATAAGPEGAMLAGTGYATLNKTGGQIYSDFEGTVATGSDAAQGGTYVVKYVYHNANGTTYDSLYDSNDQWLGFVPTTMLTATPNAQGVWQSKTGFGRVTKNYPLWQNFNWQQRGLTKSYSTVQVKGEYRHSNGATYYSLYSLAGKWLGYANATAIDFSTGAQGNPSTANEYVTVTHQYNTWANFQWVQKKAAKAVYQQTYYAKYSYHHNNGSTYLSLYDGTGTWVGYINASGVKVAGGPQGVWLKASGYATVGQPGIVSYSDFAQQQVKVTNDALRGHTYTVTGQYHQFDGTTTYSLYAGKNWRGYVSNQQVKLTSNPQGSAVAADTYITTTKLGGAIWSNFKWQNKLSTTVYYQQTYHVKNIYYHSNGSTYYSIYAGSGKWLGYINASSVSGQTGPQGAWLRNNFDVLVKSTNYNLYSDFDWTIKANAAAYAGQVVHASGVYQHFNGSQYYSLYQGSTWLGYINAAAVTPDDTIDLKVPYVSQLTPTTAKAGSAALALEMLLKKAGKDPGRTTLLKKLPLSPSYQGGQVGDPITGKGFKSLITIGTLTAFGQKYDKNLRNISGAGVSVITSEVLNGHAVLFYGFSKGQASGARNQAKVITGYDPKKGFEILDPNATTKAKGTSWLSVAKFTKEYATQTGHETVKSAMVLY